MPIVATDIKLKKTDGRHYGLMLAVDDRPLCPHARAPLRAAGILGKRFRKQTWGEWNCSFDAMCGRIEDSDGARIGFALQIAGGQEGFSSMNWDF